MDIYLIPGLALITLVIVVFLALRSKRQTEERRKSDNAPKSALAKDGDSHNKAP
jgi:response regulator RpfG family c-di-GMP phosphodiesterase